MEQFVFWSCRGVLRVYREKEPISLQHEGFGDYGLGEIQRMNQSAKDLYEARLLFEPEIAAIACRRATEEELEHIITCGELGKGTYTAARRTGQRLMGEFLRAIGAASHNVL